MYFIPASFASCTQASASNFTGFNCFASCSYSATGILRAVHDPLADAGDVLALPFAGGDRVEPPVDEEAVLGLLEPGEPRLLGLGRVGRGGLGRRLSRRGRECERGKGGEAAARVGEFHAPNHWRPPRTRARPSVAIDRARARG